MSKKEEEEEEDDHGCTQEAIVGKVMYELAHAGDVVKHTNLLLEKEAHEEAPWESLLSA